MKLLITGALGHIGSYLIRHLPIKFDITAVDNFMCQRYCSLFNIPRKICFIEKSFADLTREDIAQHDAIIHLAAVTDAEKSFENNQVDVINKTLTEEFIQKCDGKLFIFPSSTSVYGTAESIVMEDNETHVCPQSPYAESKIWIENMLKNKNSPYLIFRFGTIFGVTPGMRFHTAINRFCYQAAFNQPLTIWQDNYNKTRPYLGIGDAYRAIEHALEHGLVNQTYNVLTVNMALSEIIALIETIKLVKINFVKTPLINQYSYEVSLEKIQKTGFEPRDDIREAIVQTIGLLNYA